MATCPTFKMEVEYDLKIMSAKLLKLLYVGKIIVERFLSGLPPPHHIHQPASIFNISKAHMTK